MKRLLLPLLLFAATVLVAQSASNLKVQEFTLDNGFKVYLNEDRTATTVFGAVAVNAGGKHDPADATGIAHYLEHLLFKGTTEMGTTDYAKEKPHLDSINILYDALAKATSESERNDLQLAINRHAVEAAKYGLPNEFDRLLKSIGSTGVNAWTNEEMTFYHNSFPPSQVIKWLDIFSHRFQKPVFRSFQSELEVVYEEKNRALDNMERRLGEDVERYTFKGHPYGTQDVLGTVEHLKNPSLTKMYEYFDTYYVANNMALILCGNFDSAEIIPMIKEKFGALRTGEVPEFPDYGRSTFEGKEVVKVRQTPVKVGFHAYKTVPKWHPDEAALEVADFLIFNQSETGFLNQLQLDNKLLFCGAAPLTYKDDGAEMLFFVPKILFQSMGGAEKLVVEQLEKLKTGAFDEAMLEAVKSEIYINFQRQLEDLEGRGAAIGWAFCYGKSWEDHLSYAEKIAAVTKADVMRVANTYFGEDHLAYFSRMGFPKKPKLEKPPYKPVVTDQKGESKYAKQFAKIEEADLQPKFLDFEKDVTRYEFDGNQIFVTPNPTNDIFSLELKYWAGSHHIDKLDLAADVLNYAGTENYDLNALKQQFASLGVSYSINSSDNFFTINLSGIEANMKQAVQLVGKLLQNPRLTDQALKRVVNDMQTDRKLEENTPMQMGYAIRNYALFGDQSSFLQRPSVKEAKKQALADLQTAVQQALGYSASLHYTGKMDAGVVRNILSDALPLAKTEKRAEYFVRQPDKRQETTIYFLHDKKTVQSHVWFHVLGDEYEHEQLPLVNAFREYFGGGFSGIVTQEIREYRSLAYASAGFYITPTYPAGQKSALYAYLGCQGDKTNDAVQVMNDILTDLPAYPERMPSLRSNLENKTFSYYPDFREISTTIEDYELANLKADPDKMAYQEYQHLEFEDLQQFFAEKVQGRPVTITIYGDKKRIDLDKLRKIGKVIEVKDKEVRTE